MTFPDQSGSSRSKAIRSHARLEDLRQRREWGELSEAEHQELIQYEDQLEQDRAERLEALMNLAKLRKLDLISK